MTRIDKGSEPAAAGSLLPEDDERVDLSDLRPEDAGPLLLFWVLAGVVFLQFFSRYVLNSSIGWTEEIARYLLIGVTFLGAPIAVRKTSHIAVQFFYRYLAPGLARALSTLVDCGNIVFFAACAWISAKVAQRTNQLMTSIEVSKSLVYWIVAAGFAAMTVYAVLVAIRHWRQGYSPLTRPETQQIID